MYQLEDGNTSSLNNYLHNQDVLESQWELDLPNKQEAVIEYTVKILGGNVSDEEYSWIFSNYYEDSDEDGTIYNLEFVKALLDWNQGCTPNNLLEKGFMRNIVHTALSCASVIVYDVEVDELFDNVMQVVDGIIYDN